MHKSAVAKESGAMPISLFVPCLSVPEVPPASVDSSVYSAATPSWSLMAQVEALSAGSSVRLHLQDSADSTFRNAMPGPIFAANGALSSVRQFSAAYSSCPGLQFGDTGNSVRLMVFLDGGPGSSCTFSAWLR